MPGKLQRREERAKNARPIASFQRGQDAQRRQIWVCSNCGFAGIWGDGWMWHGSYQDVDEGVMIAVQCPDCPFDASIPQLVG